MKSIIALSFALAFLATDALTASARALPPAPVPSHPVVSLADGPGAGGGYDPKRHTGVAHALEDGPGAGGGYDPKRHAEATDVPQDGPGSGGGYGPK